MSFFVYILYSISKDRYYIGSSKNVEARLLLHNTGRNFSTKYGLPWELKKTESYKTLKEARQREMFIKRMKSKNFIEQVIEGNR